MKPFLSRRLVKMSGLSGAMLVLAAGLAASPAMAASKSAFSASLSASSDISACAAPTLTQPFVSIGDSNLYSLAAGESPDNFAGTGWILAGGARIIQTTLADGTTGPVLDLPGGASAVSPQMCVTSDYPTARTMVRDVVGSEGVRVGVSYAGTGVQTVGQVHGQQSAWTASNPFNVHPSTQTGWQLAQFTFVAGGKTSDFQIYDFYVDPRMHY
jgi:hypothetical protein